jgi:hypothetical protein
MSRRELSGGIFRRGLVLLAIAVVGAVIVPTAGVARVATAADPFHVRIDQLVETAGPGGLAPLAGDAEFLRRVSLDLAGRIPTAAETRAFLDDTSPEKRVALVDRLLASPQYAQHLSAIFDIALMERRGDKSIPAAEWRKYLVDSFATNKPWDVLAREILASDGSDPKLRPAAKFYLDREGEPNLLTRDISRVFFGMDVQCAQCHDHPLIDDYLQRDYYGVFAFLTRSFVFTDKKDNKQVFFAEKADGEAKFTSVFTKVAGQTGPRVPGGDYVVEPVFAKGQEYSVAPADNVRPVPKYSRRQELARQATLPDNRQFSRNIANRLWAVMLGRGLVEPVDLHHSGNPPTHPQLLELLTDEIAALKFDMRAFLRGIALSRTYQRGFEVSPPSLDPAMTAQQLASLEAEVKQLEAAASERQSAWATALKTRDEAEKGLAPLNDELEKAVAAESKAFEASSKAAAALTAAQQTLATKQELATLLATAAGKTAEAVKKVPEDKELAAAADKFQAKAKTLETEAAAATKSASDLAGPAKTAADALAAASGATQTVHGKIAALRGSLDPLRKQVWTAESQLRSAQYAMSQATARAQDAKLAVQLSTLAASVNGSAAAIAKTQADIAANKEMLAKLAAELPKKQAELAEAMKARDESAKALADAQQALAAGEGVAKSLAEAVASAEAAKAKLPNDAEVVAAAAAVKTRSDKAVADLEPLKKTVADRVPPAEAANQKFVAAGQAVAAVQTPLTAAQQLSATLDAALKPLVEKRAADQAALEAVRQEWSQRWSQRFYASGLRPLWPEQMAMSVLQATGVVASYRASTEAEVAKTTPLTDAIKNDPAQMAARERQIEQLIQDKLKGSVTTFVNLFGGAAGQNQGDFFATVDQALFFANGGMVMAWLGPSGDNLTGRCLKLDNAQAIADELYLGVLTRRPTAQEVADVAAHLNGRDADKAVALQEIAWALLTSAEFRFNH